MKPHVTSRPSIHDLIRQQEKAQFGHLLAASVCAAAVAVAAVVLLGLSAWFLTASAIAGLGGPLVAKAFNYMIPSAMIRLLAIVRTAARYGERVTGHNAALHALAALRPQLFAAIARSDKGQSLSSGEASARLMQDVDAVQNRFVRLSAPWGAGAGIAAGVITCAFAGWPVALGVALIGLAYIVCAVLLAKRVTQEAGRQVRTTAGQLKDTLSSLSAAAPELRAYGMSSWACDRVNADAVPYVEAREKLARGTAWLALVQSLAMAASVVLVVLTTASGSAALMALALLSAIAVLDACGTLVGAIGQRGEVEMATARLDALMATAKSYRADERVQSYIDIKGLSPLRPRSRLGICGASGAGKSTLVEQLMKLRSAPEGHLRMGGHDLSRLSPQRARSLFAYAAQQTHFINGSVADNLRLAAPNATDAELWSALERACLDVRIRASGSGLAMPTGENGNALSGGERRRLGLARAYLRPAPFLILDEPTEGLDAATEFEVIKHLRAHLATSGQGLILISHRSHPLTLCDEVAQVSGVNSEGSVKLAVIHAHKNSGTQSFAI